MSNSKPSTTPIWLILPGLIFYNLVGRHLAYRRARRMWIEQGRDLSEFWMRPGWIKLSDIRSLNRG